VPCPNTCVTDGDCATGNRCASGTCVPICSGGTCTCAAGLVYCAAANACIQPGLCCADSDCSAAPDLCHSLAGAKCDGGVCLYPAVVCSGNWSCAPALGTCSASPLTLTVTPSLSTYTYSSAMFDTG